MLSGGAGFGAISVLHVLCCGVVDTMIKIFVLVTLAVACNADLPVTPPPQFRCGSTPKNLYKCLGNPQVIQHSIVAQCTKPGSECEKIKCIFEKSGWMDGEKVNKQKVIDYFEQFAKDHPDWSPAVQQVKTGCLSRDLPAQGALLNCPAYDVMMCSLTGFVKNAQPSQWSSSSDCEYPRQFAASCPLCPEDCFVPLVPYGSCNACVLLPRSP